MLEVKQQSPPEPCPGDQLVPGADGPAACIRSGTSEEGVGPSPVCLLIRALEMLAGICGGRQPRVLLPEANLSYDEGLRQVQRRDGGQAEVHGHTDGGGAPTNADHI